MLNRTWEQIRTELESHQVLRSPNKGAVYRVLSIDDNAISIERVDTGSSVRVTKALIDRTAERQASGEIIPRRGISYTVAIETTVVAALGTSIEEYVQDGKPGYRARVQKTGGNSKNVDLSVTEENSNTSQPKHFESTLGISGAGHRKRISLPETIGREVLLRAIDRINANGFAPHHVSHTYDLVHENRKYPPVAVVAFAYEENSGKPIAPGAIRGGKNTQAFRILEDAGFTVRPKYHNPNEDEAAGPSPKANDLNADTNGETERRDQYISRIIRDIPKARELKVLYENHCQICDHVIQLVDGQTYSEAHHIRPLGRDHDGPDSRDNILVLCPNHHTLCDYFAIRLNIDTLIVHSEHALNPEYIAYHNKQHEITLSHGS